MCWGACSVGCPVAKTPSWFPATYVNLGILMPDVYQDQSITSADDATWNGNAADSDQCLLTKVSDNIRIEQITDNARRFLLQPISWLSGLWRCVETLADNMWVPSNQDSIIPGHVFTTYLFPRLKKQIKEHFASGRGQLYYVLTCNTAAWITK